MDPTNSAKFQNLTVTDFNRLQQELIEVQTQRDRQIGQLKRLNSLSDALLTNPDHRTLVESFAEAIVEVLDVGIGSIWLFDDDLSTTTEFAVCGMKAAHDIWVRAGPDLLGSLPDASRRTSHRLCVEQLGLLCGPELVEGLACRCLSRDGGCRGLLLAANTASHAGMSGPITQDSLEVFSLLAEKLAAYLDHIADRRLIVAQMLQLQESEQRLTAVLKGANDGWWDLDLSSGRCFLSSRWHEMLGEASPAQGAEGSFWNERIHPEERQRFDWLLDQVLRGRSEILETELRLSCHDGQYLPVLIRGTVIHRSDGTPQRFSGSMQDLTERRRHEAQVHRLAFYDALTDLPNRRMLEKRMADLMNGSGSKGTAFALMMLDLDHFKTLNDSHGHAAGDQLLRVVSQRLLNCLRRSDMVARLGGDEFVILIENLPAASGQGSDVTLRLANKVIEAISEPIQLEIGVVHQSVSVGIAHSDGPECTFERLMQQADLALYEAKAAGRNRVETFQLDMQRRVDLRSLMELRIREGMNLGAFSAVYQLQVNARCEPIGCEALIHWKDIDGSDVPPAEFLPVAQDSGLIHPLGRIVTHQVFQDLLAWEQNGIPADFRIAINFSTPEFLRADFIDTVLAFLDSTGVSGQHLVFEITEDSVLSDLVLAADRMNELIDHKIEFSLDDFGTGYSSFSYLRYLPVREVKIDRAFVRRFLHQSQDAAIVRAIIELGRSLGLRVVAEGVETEAQWRALQQEGCELFQGWLFDRPSPETRDPLLQRLSRLRANPLCPGT